MNPSRMRKTVGGISLSFVLAIVVGLSGVIAPGGGTALGASTTLTIIGGEVLLSRAGGAFEPAADGAVIGPGDSIRTAAGARAVLTYFEGSTVSIEPSSELAIDEASSSSDGSTIVAMTQNLGRTWHVVTKLITGGSKYEVRTPAATASVRGTTFAVGVVQDATGATVTEVSTTEGAVAASAPATAADPRPEPVVVAAGFQTKTTPGERKPQAPTLAPQPERKVTVTVGSANSLVVDPLGRANGVKDGKLVLQTPGAQVTKVDGKLVITLPNLPDGKVATFVPAAAGNANVNVATVVEERGKPAARTEDTVQGGSEGATGVEVRHSPPGSGAAAELRKVNAEEVKDLTPKVRGDAEEREEKKAPSAVRPGLGGLVPSIVTTPASPAPKVADTEAKKVEETKDEEKKDSGVPSGGSPPAGQPPSGSSNGGGGAGTSGRTTTPAAPAGARGGFVPPPQPIVIPGPGTAQAEREKAAEDARKKAAEDARKKAAEDAKRGNPGGPTTGGPTVPGPAILPPPPANIAPPKKEDPKKEEPEKAPTPEQPEKPNVRVRTSR